MADIIKETKNYKLTTGKSTHHSDSPELLLYQVVNKEYGVVEMETSVLARAFSALAGLQEELDTVMLASVQPDEEAYLAMQESEAPTLN